jgi:hypothetical protein
VSDEKEMAVIKFVVAAHDKGASNSTSSIAPVGGPLVAVLVIGAALVFQIDAVEVRWKIVSIGCLLMMLLNHLKKQRAASACQVTVEVFPLGVQLLRNQKSSLFIPRDVILDVVVNEVILAHKVVSVVLFRILKENKLHEPWDASDVLPTTSTLLREGRVHLVPAFPGVEMRFAECHMMRKELSSALCMKSKSSTYRHQASR